MRCNMYGYGMYLPLVILMVFNAFLPTTQMEKTKGDKKDEDYVPFLEDTFLAEDSFVSTLDSDTPQETKDSISWQKTQEKEEASKAEATLSDLQKSVEVLTRQLLLHQLYLEEMTRSNGHSGLKQIRQFYGGTRPYHSAHHSCYSVASIHDHANYIDTVGMGEVIAVLNGVEFRTRHNDYPLRMPHPTSKAYHDTVPVPLPDVPPEVLAMTSLQEQMVEMKEWFRAFQQENDTVRDYKKYFKPVLCYLEGAWTNRSDSFDPPFESTRHAVEATTWEEMEDQIRFTSYNGRKHLKENYVYLPSKVIGINNNYSPVLAQWNYRILCHPLKKYLKPSDLKPVDDLANRAARRSFYPQFRNLRSARFRIMEFPKERYTTFTTLDEIMSEVPGKDNYVGNVVDDAFGIPALKFNSENNTVLNAAFYHRYYKLAVPGAMGQVNQLRGFSDSNLFVALNTQNKIPGSKIKVCSRYDTDKTCTTYHQRLSYAIPLEIIYLTPLSKWNPYNIEYKGEYDSPLGEIVTAEGRYGAFYSKHALNGTNSAYYYMTPWEFFSEAALEGDSADTSGKAVGVLDRNGTIQKVAASGIRTLSAIADVGTIRQRYPIMPVYGEGSAVWKELEALEDAVMDNRHYDWLYRQKPEVTCLLLYELTESRNPTIKPHKHHVYLDVEKANRAWKGEVVETITSQDNGHYHVIVLWRPPGQITYFIKACDGRANQGSPDICWDEHGTKMHWLAKTC